MLDDTVVRTVVEETSSSERVLVMAGRCLLWKLLEL
jgi:hypothetical protein